MKLKLIEDHTGWYFACDDNTSAYYLNRKQALDDLEMDGVELKDDWVD